MEKGTLNSELSFGHLNGMQAGTDGEINRQWDEAFAKVAGTSGTTTKRTVLSGWAKAFRKAARA